MFNSVSNKEIYDNSYLSFVFEFFTPLPKREAAAKFSRALGKKVKWFNHLNSDFTPTVEAFKVSPVYSNGYKEISLETGVLPYQEAIHMFLKTMHVIESIGYTTQRCSVKTKIKLDTDSLNLTAKLHNLNQFKYLLGLDESKLLDLWPIKENEEKLIYQNHLVFIQPKDIYNKIITEQYFERMSPVEFNFPTSDFFANDFSELGHGNLIVKYIGGKDYTKKRKESVNTINLIIEHLYNTLSNNWKYSDTEKRKISKIVESYRGAILNTKNYLNFKSKYENIDLYVDLNNNKFLIDSHYTKIREKIFKLIVGGEITEAIINYDTERGAIQIKNAKINKSILIENIEFYSCIIEADAKNCLFNNCDIVNSKICESTIHSNNIIKNSKVIDCLYSGGITEIKSSFIDNGNRKIINANLSECLVYSGIFSAQSTIDKNTKIIKKLN